MEDRYRIYSKYLKDKYGEKVYKLPINLPITCPNRDENGYGGCTFCADVGAGFESLQNTLSVKEQLSKNMEYIKERYKARKFIAYFQNYTNTYMKLSDFREYIKDAKMDNIVEIDISTRPDAINDEYLKALKDLQEEGINISIELGLQTVNYHTLNKINRGHTLAEFIDAILRIKKYGFETCAHLILNLPGDTIDDVIESAKVLSALKVDGVKLHSLYIVKGTQMAKEYENKSIDIISLDEYVKRVATFLEYLNEDIVIHRLIGRAPEENTLFCNWNTSWWKIKDMIDEYMKENDIYQGKKCDYLNGKTVKKFI
ncbi:TIGR01212 family radical SAM protein [Alkalithermobacter paradoxus]|uniref:Oxygen-independent coproporphyrinogen-III oxidase-like protein n=1 Tax=Alkalithermobacter paradoxus TaxID=29349 RepID=A0A1V4I7J2_9FIRM|nr:oxygen-independent coproporphyrinogen-III oxidase-like protein [[Clostridium] thermoalcaliphilum]